MPTHHDALKWTLLTPIMRLLDPLRRRRVARAIAALAERVPLTPTTRVLDVGCGTGTVLTALRPYGCQLTAAEPTRRMLDVVRRRFPEVRALEEPAHAMPSVADHSQDVVIVSAMLHGLPPAYRREVYRELSRVTRGVVAVLDYHANRSWLVAAAELAEGGDYFRFVRVVDAELREAFPEVTTVRLGSIESLYLCAVAAGPSPSAPGCAAPESAS